MDTKYSNPAPPLSDAPHNPTSIKLEANFLLGKVASISIARQLHYRLSNTLQVK